MNRRFALPALLLALALPALADVKSDLQARYNTVGAAIKKKSVKDFMSVFASNYIDIGKDGKKQTRKEYEADVATQFKQPFTVTSVTFKINGIAAKGGTQIVDCVMAMKMSVMNPQTKKNSTVDITVDAKDTWAKEKGIWMLKASTTKSEKVAVDGKVIRGGR